MADRRRLQGEIDKTLKKVNDGCDDFDDIWGKILSASNPNQKDKYETELKKEIKKLQRLREQIKNWQSSNEIKDKKPLSEARKSIEHQMEKFRAIERDIKSKSKDGSKFDPLIKEQEEMKEWLNESVNELNNQVESYEEKLEELNNNKKKRTDKDQKIETLKTRIDTHKKYINNLEKLTNMVQDNTIALKKVQDIKDDVDEYIEHNEDVDFEENQYLFDDLNLDTIMPNTSSCDNENEDEEELEISHTDNSSTNSNSPCESPTHFLNTSSSNTNTASSSANTTAIIASNASTQAKGSNNISSATDASNKKRRRHKSEGHANNNIESEQQSPANTSQQATSNIISNQTANTNINTNLNTGSQQRTNKNSSNTSSKNVKATPPSSTVQSQPNASPVQSISSSAIVSSGSPSASSTIITNTTSPISFSAALLTNTTTTTTTSTQKPASKQSPPQSEDILSISPTKQPPQHQQSIPLSGSPPNITQADVIPLNGIEIQQQQQQQQAPSSQDYVNMMNGNSQQAQDQNILSLLNSSGNMNSLKSMAESAIERLQMQQQQLIDQTTRLGIQIPVGGQLSTGQTPNLSPSSLQMLNQQQAQQQQVQLLQQQHLQQQQHQQQQLQNTNQETFIQPILGVAPLGKVPLSKDQSQQLDILDSALKKLPQPSDSERIRSYFPRAPALSPHYPVMPPPGHDTLDFLCKLSTETLFFMFYYMEGTKAQFLAAQALKKLSWRFHIRYMMWFQRSEEPEMITDDFEQGTYIYFDFEKWAQRKKEGFTFEYKYLEDKDLNAY